MATKPKQPKVEETTVPSGDAGVDREATVQEAPELSFEQRTAVTQPWLNEDGTQNNGDVVVAEPAIEE